jgi:hypothetical protein
LGFAANCGELNDGKKDWPHSPHDDTFANPIGRVGFEPDSVDHAASIGLASLYML